MTKRRLFSQGDLLAAAYIRLGLIPEPLASTGTAKQIVAYIQGDHNLPFALGGETVPQNCNLLSAEDHAAKTARDIAIIAKVKRIADAHAAFRRKVIAKGDGLQCKAPAKTRKGNRPMPCGRHSGWRKPLGQWNAVRREP